MSKQTKLKLLLFCLLLIVILFIVDFNFEHRELTEGIRIILAGASVFTISAIYAVANYNE